MPAPQVAPPPRGQRRRQRTRSALIDAGQRLFAERAVEGVTVDDIVAEADVAKGSFYNHFDGKDALANAIVELVHGDCEFHILAANREVADPAARIVRALCVAIAYAAAHPDRLQALMSLSERRKDIESPLNAGVRRDIGDGLAAGRFAGITIEAAVLMAIAVIGATVTRAIGGEAAPAALAATVGGALLRAFGVADAVAKALAAAAVAELLCEEKNP